MSNPFAALGDSDSGDESDGDLAVADEGIGLSGGVISVATAQNQSSSSGVARQSGGMVPIRMDDRIGYTDDISLGFDEEELTAACKVIRALGE
jgi:hypothetical protein